jgi:CheY-like chemotaxis protein
MTPEFPYVLLADDDPDDRHFFSVGMQRLYPDVSFRLFEDGEPLLDYLNDCAWAALPGCIILDYKMPRLTAPQLLRVTGPGTRYAHIPKMVWSTSQRKKDMDDCLVLGAARFELKPETDAGLDELIRTLGCWICKSRTPGS